MVIYKLINFFFILIVYNINLLIKINQKQKKNAY